MIYELRTTQVQPGGVARYEQRLAAALGTRQRHSRLAGCWHTEIGPLNQVIELWPYADEHDRDRVAEAVANDGGWPPADGGLVQSMVVELLRPTPFMQPLDGSPQTVGPIFELRIYQIRTGEIPPMIEKWGPMIPGRTALSALLGCWYSDQGRWFHLWPYADLAERSRVRAEAQRQGVWPPATSAYQLAQENKILLPAPFSPLS